MAKERMLKCELEGQHGIPCSEDIIGVQSSEGEEGDMTLMCGAHLKRERPHVYALLKRAKCHCPVCRGEQVQDLVSVERIEE